MSLSMWMRLASQSGGIAAQLSASHVTAGLRKIAARFAKRVTAGRLPPSPCASPPCVPEHETPALVDLCPER